MPRKVTAADCKFEFQEIKSYRENKKYNWILIVFCPVHNILPFLQTLHFPPFSSSGWQHYRMSRRREIFVCLYGLCPKADPVQWSGVSVVNLMLRDGGTSRTKAGFILDLGKVSYNGRGFISVFFVIYLIWWWRERGGKAVGEGTAFADWIHNATLSSCSPNSPELLNLSSSKYWKHADAVVSAPSFYRRNKMLHGRAWVFWDQLCSCLVFRKPSSVIGVFVNLLIEKYVVQSNVKPYYCWT